MQSQDSAGRVLHKSYFAMVNVGCIPKHGAQLPLALFEIMTITAGVRDTEILPATPIKEWEILQ